jgi:Tfp pilus assembly protein PilN
MAIEIIPRKKIGVPTWQIILFVISLFLIFGVVSIYFVLDGWQKKYQGEIQQIKDRLEKERTPEIREMENKLSSSEKKIQDFSKILSDHLFVSEVFSLLQRTCHPKLSYNQFELIPEENKLSLSGRTDDFLILGQQVLLLKEESMVKDVDLSKISITKKGKVEFTFDISLNPEIFGWKK